MICDNCNWDYPFEFLAPFSSSTINKSNVCGICALDLSNIVHVHSKSRIKFDGVQAEEFRQLALRWRKRHPSKGPQHATT